VDVKCFSFNLIIIKYEKVFSFYFNRIIKNQLNNLECSAQSVLNQTHFFESSVVNYVEVGANINASSSNIISNNSEISSSILVLHDYVDNENYNYINNDHLLIDSVDLQKSSEITENIVLNIKLIIIP